MSQASKPAVSAGRVTFELDRLAVTRGDRCVVEGRWFGVRGRRFIRPSLTVTVDGEATRLLADLEDKPWAAEDGEQWKATFPFTQKIADLRKAELNVAPDITITLPGSAAGSDAGRPKPRRKSQRPQEGRRGSGASPLARELADTQGEQRRLARELDRISAEKGQTAARLDELLGQLSQAIRQRDALAIELDALRRAGDEAAQDSEAARAERDRALAARDDAVLERDALARTNERLQSELAGAASTRGAALVMRRAAQERATSHRSAAVVLAAVAALAALAIIVVLIVLRGV